MTKLQALNRLLSRVGYGPTDALDNGTGSMFGVGERKIDEEDEQIQKRGWHFNRFGYGQTPITISPDGSNHVLIPAGTVYHIDTYGTHAHVDVKQEGDRLYNLDANTDEFTEAVQVVYTLKIDWDDIPPAFQNWIVAEAAITFARDWALNRITRDDRREILAELREERDRAMLDAQREEGDARDTNLLQTPEALRIKGHRNTFYGGAFSNPF